MSASKTPLRTVATLVEGEHCRVAGTIRAVSSIPLQSQLGKVACVYWDVREGLSDEPRESDAQPFWIEDASGRVLVRSQKFAVEARAVRQKMVLSAVATDLGVVSERLKQIKELLGKSAGGDAAALQREKKHLAKVATLLCAIRAHARGRVHLGGTLRSQEKWIHANSHLTKEGGPGAKTTNLMVDRWETVLQDGEPVEIEGIVSTEPAPPEIARGASYREASTVRVIVAPDARGVRIIGQGDHAPPTEEERREMEAEAEGEIAEFTRPRRGAVYARAAVGLGGAASVLAALAWWLMKR